MAGGNNQRDDFMSDINVTPLVDVMLVLLVVMMVTASYVVTRSLSVDLPKSATGNNADTPLLIELDASGAWRMNGQPVDTRGVRAELTRLREQRLEPSCVIAADGATAHQHVVNVMDVLPQESVTRVAIGVQPK